MFKEPCEWEHLTKFRLARQFKEKLASVVLVNQRLSKVKVFLLTSSKNRRERHYGNNLSDIQQIKKNCGQIVCDEFST